MNMKQEQWQKPEETDLGALQRAMLHTDWLRRQHEDVKRAIEEKKPIIEKEFIPGGFED